MLFFFLIVFFCASAVADLFEWVVMLMFSCVGVMSLDELLAVVIKRSNYLRIRCVMIIYDSSAWLLSEGNQFVTLLLRVR